MRVDELTFSQARELRTGSLMPGEIKAKLQDWGFELAGAGMYSEVWHSSSGNVVVKISKGKPDRCWMIFAQYARQNPNPHLPKIGKISTPRIDNTEYFIVFLEKLDNFDPRHYNLTQGQWGSMIHDAHIAMMDGDWERIYNSSDVDPEYEDYFLYRDKIPQSFWKTVNTLYHNLPEGCGPDMHFGNIMARGNTPVIIDPYAAAMMHLDM